MKKSQFRSLIVIVANKLLSLTASKGEEYARSDDQLANFKRQGVDNDFPPEGILMIYLNKHLDSIKKFVRDLRTKEVGQIQESEPIEGRIDDAILYLVLLRALIAERRDPDLRGLVDRPDGYSLGWVQTRNSLDDAFDSVGPGNDRDQ